MENIAQYLEHLSLITYLVVFAGGFAVSFTPCVYPLIPIIVSVIGASGSVSRFKAFILSLGYVLGMAVTFSMLGLLAAMTGKLFGRVQSSAITHIVVGNVIILFALALLDVIPLPSFLFARVGAGRVVKGGGFFSAFSMGIISGFIAAPCTAAVLGALLTYVASTGNVIAGFSLLFTFAVGFGTVLVLAGTFTGFLAAIPRSEKVMGIVQKTFAIALILLGEYFVFRAGVLSL